MAPGIEVPVVAIVGEPLRRDFAFAGLAAVAIVILDDEPFALQYGSGDALKESHVFSASSHSQDADAFVCFAAAEMFGVEERVDSCSDGRKRMIQQAGQGVVTISGVVTITAMCCVEDKGSAKLVTQVGDESGEFGARNLQLFYQCLTADGAASSIEQAVQSVEVVGSAQGGLLISNP